MDINANLDRQREIRSELERTLDMPSSMAAARAVELSGELVDLMVGMDDWLSRGGALPKDWSKK